MAWLARQPLQQVAYLHCCPNSPPPRFDFTGAKLTGNPV
jgi:hypothetical protein